MILVWTTHTRLEGIERELHFVEAAVSDKLFQIIFNAGMLVFFEVVSLRIVSTQNQDIEYD